MGYFGIGLMKPLSGSTVGNTLDNVRVEIGGLGIRFRYKDCLMQERESGEAYVKDFVRPYGKNDLAIDVERGKPPLYPRSHKLFEARENWRVFEDTGSYIFEIFQQDKSASSRIKSVCFVEKGLSSGKVYILPEEPGCADNNVWSLEELMRMLGHLLLASILHRHQALLIHASGVVINKEGILFCGISGAGKTTLSRLWQKRAGSTVLSDDRVLVRKEKEGYVVYGTPWPGEGRIVSCQKAPLRRIAFLSKARKNSLIRLRKEEALHQIVTQCFPPLWDRDGICAALEFCGALLEAVPSFCFGFVPDESAVEFIETTFHHD
jgi:hypothetical protein